MDEPFWLTKPLEALEPAEWESLCDGCGRCCLIKLEDEDEGTVEYTDVCCDYLDVATCRCTRYEERFELGTDCQRLAPDNVAEMACLPPSCAYRLVAHGHDLPPWHPLRTGRPESVHEAGVSVSGRVVREAEVDADELEDHVIDSCW